MDWAAVAATLVDAGGWAALLVGAGGFATIFVRGHVVARPFFDQQVARGDRLEGELDRMTDAFTELTNEIRRDRTDRLMAGGRRG